MSFLEVGQLGYAFVLLATGSTVGFTCGLLGVGGGFIMIPIQIWALTSSGIDPTIATRTAFGTSLAVILLTSLSGCYGHSCHGAVLWRQGAALGLSGLAGAFLGGTIAAHAPGDLLKVIFGVVVLIAALRMLLASNIHPIGKPKEGLLSYIAWGSLVGVVSGLMGIGGGMILIPIMVMLLGLSMHQAIGTSTVAIAFNAAGGVLSYAINGWGVPGLPACSIGYIDLLQFALLAGICVLTTQLGVNIAHMLPGNQLRYIFIALAIYVGLKMLGIFDFMIFVISQGI